MPSALAGGAFLETEANLRRIDGYRDRWMLKAALVKKRPRGSR
jgi:hypothetical protein